VALPGSPGRRVGFPQPPSVYDDLKSKAPRKAESRLIAWDPVQQREIWRTDVLGTIGGGTLSTAGGLVFQGTNGGRFVAYDAKNGRELWSMQTQTGVVAAPASFELDGEQPEVPCSPRAWRHSRIG
jgi:quinohemoprotein ethanol dehydrogenase